MILKISLISFFFLLGSFASTPSIDPSTNFDKVPLNPSTNFVDLILTNGENTQVLPNPEVLNFGIKGYLRLLDAGEIEKGKPLTVIDFSLPSTQKRIWVIDVQNGLVLHHDVVSHGRNSGGLWAEKFSNINSSFMSSLGFYLTGETYHGKHGYSLRLDGLENEFNDNARERAIVIHGAEYANENFASQTGRLGRSLGCPALPNESAATVIDLIKDRSCIFIYAEDATYLKKSSFLNS